MSTPEFFTPWQNVIESATQANPCVITTVRDHGYSDGLVVSFFVPRQCGMSQLHNKTLPITVINATSFSVPIDSRGFDPFITINPAIVETYRYLAQVLPTAENALTLSQAINNNNNNIFPEIYAPNG
jgi:hypothetical protein